FLLHGLSESETAALIAAATAVGERHASPAADASPTMDGAPRQRAGKALAEALHRETEGNPFFLQETLRHLAESGTLTPPTGRRTGAIPSIAELGIPEGVREVIGRRLSRLSSE